MDNLMLNLKMGSKTMEREAKKCEKDMKSYRLKVKKALEEQNTEVAQIHAETAIRKKNERKHFCESKFLIIQLTLSFIDV